MVIYTQYTKFNMARHVLLAMIWYDVLSQLRSYVPVFAIWAILPTFMPTINSTKISMAVNEGKRLAYV